MNLFARVFHFTNYFYLLFMLAFCHILPTSTIPEVALIISEFYQVKSFLNFHKGFIFNDYTVVLNYYIIKQFLYFNFTCIINKNISFDNVQDDKIL